MDIVLFNRDNCLEGFASLDEFLPIERLDRRHVEHAGRYLLLIQQVCSLQAALTLRTSRYQQHILTPFKQVRFAQLEFISRIENVRTHIPSKAKIDGAFEFGSPSHRRLALRAVNWRYNRHPR